MIFSIFFLVEIKIMAIIASNFKTVNKRLAHRFHLAHHLLR